ncbi:hypothetical protein [Bacillus sp. FJAT-45037]|uniref:hypothetical protein n=1 Tax=Bacillus sp. FJAT-45037 TaxID=2011007 RepID=UPI0012FD4456|nr:hypothetical protein [Bacillus sp. FJAT-45037]
MKIVPGEYLTKKERAAISDLEAKMAAATTDKELLSYKTQLGLIMERVLIRCK